MRYLLTICQGFNIIIKWNPITAGELIFIEVRQFAQGHRADKEQTKELNHPCPKPSFPLDLISTILMRTPHSQLVSRTFSLFLNDYFKWLVLICKGSFQSDV